VERSFSTYKDTATTGIRRGWCRLLGRAKSLIMLSAPPWWPIFGCWTHSTVARPTMPGGKQLTSRPDLQAPTITAGLRAAHTCRQNLLVATRRARVL